MTMSRRSSRTAMRSSTVAQRDVSKSRSSLGLRVKGTNARSHSYDAFTETPLRSRLHSAKSYRYGAASSLHSAKRCRHGAASSLHSAKRCRHGAASSLHSAKRCRHGAASSGDLIQEPDIRIVKDPDVRDVVTQHRDAGRPHSERPTRITLGVQARSAYHRRVHHAGAKDLHPSSAFAAGATGPVAELALHVHLRGRFGERKITRPETRFRFPEESVRKMGQRCFEIDEADAFIDRQSFDLSEHWRVRCVEEIATIRVS